MRNYNFKTISIIFIIIGLIGYLSGLNYPFIYDDISAIVENKKLHEIDILNNIFSGLRQIRVLQNITFAIDWKISGPSPWSFRLTNIVIHLINASVFFNILKNLKIQRDKVIIMVTLFIIAPLQIQSVHYVMGRVSLMQGFFYLIILKIFIDNNQRVKKVSVLILISLLVKESAALIPLFLIIVDLILNQFEYSKIKIKEHMVYWLILPVYIILYYLLKDPLSMYDQVTGFNLFPFFRYTWTQFYYYVFYFYLFLDPSWQSILHSFPTWDYKILTLGGIGLVLLFSLIISIRKIKNSAFSIFASLFLINLLPTNFIFQMINPFAEYRLYLSNCFLIFLLVECIYLICEKLNIKNFITLIFVLLLSYQVAFLFLNIHVFRNEHSPYLYAFELYPNSPQNNFYYGGVLEKMRNPNAEIYYKKALDFYKEDPYPRRFAIPYVLAFYYFLKRRHLESIKILQENNDLNEVELGQKYYYYDLLSNNYKAINDIKMSEKYKEIAEYYRKKLEKNTTASET